MDFWLGYIGEDPSQAIEVARFAEAAGYRGVALADHVAVPVAFASVHPSGGPTPFDHRSDFPDPLITAAAILSATTHLQVMTYVYVLPAREPFSVASQVATLDVLSGGRFRFGVGAGWLEEEIELLGHPARRRGRRMDEMLEIMRHFWSEEVVEFHGEFFDFGPTGVAPRPRGHLPVWVGGKSPAALARAARHDGWLGMNYELEEIHTLLGGLAEARERSERRVSEDFEVFVIPNAAPDAALYADLADRGVTATLGSAWAYDAEGFESLDAKREAIDTFSRRFIHDARSD